MYRVIDHTPPSEIKARICALKREAQGYDSSARSFGKKGQMRRALWAHTQMIRVQMTINQLSQRL